MNAGSNMIKAGPFVGRVGPLAATLGIGLAVMAGGTGTAAADPVTPTPRRRWNGRPNQWTLADCAATATPVHGAHWRGPSPPRLPG